MKLLLFLSLSIFVSCSSTYNVQDNDKFDYISKINDLCETYNPTVTLNNGEIFSSDSLQIENDTLYVLRYKREAIPLDSVSTIKLRDVMRGAFDGAFMGIPIALASGIISRNPFVLYFAGTFGVAISTVINALFSGNKTFVFKRNIDNSFSRIE